MMLKRFVIVILTLSAFASCSGRQVNENDPASLFEDAQEDIQDDHYQIAIDKLRKIRNKFPYSKYAVEAQLRIADVYFLQESFPEAAQSYETFRDLHPKNEKMPYAMFRIGKSYFRDMPSTVARDITSAQRALDAYTDFTKRFPTAPEAKEAAADIAEIRRVLSEKEVYVARFYFKRDQWDAARTRYEKLLALYPDTEYADEAKEKLNWLNKEHPQTPRKVDATVKQP